jgi:hypothetical protein
MQRFLLTALLSTGVLTSGCGMHAAPLATGAAGGTALGAGTGAIIGAVIANGDIASSALLGGAIGLPVGLAIAAAYDYNSERTIQEAKDSDIRRNQSEILARQRYIDELREEIRADSPSGNPAEERQEYRYMGPSLGNPYR